MSISSKIDKQNQKITDNTIIIIATVDHKKENITTWNKEKEKEKDLIRKGIGFFVQHNNKKMIVTAGHVIRNTKQIFGLKIIKDGMDAIKIDLMLVINSIEFDIGILVLADEYLTDKLFVNPLTLDDFKFTLPKEKDKVKLIALDTVDDQDGIFYKSKISKWFVKNITIEQIHSNNIPKSVLINISSIDIFESIVISYNGLSGAPCFDIENKIIGMIDMAPSDQDIFENVEINIIPILSIQRIIKEYVEYNMYKGICSLYFEHEFVTNKLFKHLHNLNNNYVKITNNYSINYGNNKYKLEIGDVLLYIDNNYIDDNGHIYYPELKYKVPIHTYIMMNYISNETINITLIRNNNLINLKIIATPIWKYLFVPFSTNYGKNKTYVIYKDIIFIEISEDLIEQYVKQNEQLIGPFIEHHIHTKFREGKGKGEEERIVVLIDLVESPNPRRNIINKINHPLFEHTYSKPKPPIKYVPSLKKINRKKIININDVKKILYNKNKDKDKDKEFEFEFEVEFNNNVIIKY